ncbi:MAG: hypothetical protein O3C62_06985 [Actinomycetota bacterium]|nr:hypothetical protein [Actinomycetota bacterium]MDA2972320.1 hypothetical protein [Actinomycetota bacterium]MDA3001408.1 hypothetical protein [Actinomycetota bacterium]
MNNSNVNTTSPMDLTEPGFPGKGVGYDWQSVVAEAAAAHLDLELATALAAARTVESVAS